MTVDVGQRIRAFWIFGLSLVLVSAAWRPASAGPVFLFEPDKGEVLIAENADQTWFPASLTKMMTAYVVFDAIKAGKIAWDSKVPLSDYARGQPATRIGLRLGIELTVEQAVRGMILRSANDFSVGLAELVGGSEEGFAKLQNAVAAKLGMTRSHFKNPHGLPDPEQVTTAREMAILTTALLKDFPDRAEVFSTPMVRIHKQNFHSQNTLLRTFAGADGMKTGFTCGAGYNIVTSATRNGRRVIAVVLGAQTSQKRTEQAAGLMELGFAHYAGTAPLRTVVLKDLAFSPPTTPPVFDMSRLTATHKCGNSRRRLMARAPGLEAGSKAAETGAGDAAPAVAGSGAPAPAARKSVPAVPGPSAPVAADRSAPVAKDRPAAMPVQPPLATGTPR